MRVDCEGKSYDVDRWADVAAPADLPVVGEVVKLPVSISTYRRRDGTAGYSLRTGDMQQRGEAF